MEYSNCGYWILINEQVRGVNGRVVVFFLVYNTWVICTGRDTFFCLVGGRRGNEGKKLFPKVRKFGSGGGMCHLLVCFSFNYFNIKYFLYNIKKLQIKNYFFIRKNLMVKIFFCQIDYYY